MHARAARDVHLHPWNDDGEACTCVWNSRMWTVCRCIGIADVKSEGSPKHVYSIQHAFSLRSARRVVDSRVENGTRNAGNVRNRSRSRVSLEPRSSRRDRDSSPLLRSDSRRDFRRIRRNLSCAFKAGHIRRVSAVTRSRGSRSSLGWIDELGEDERRDRPGPHRRFKSRSGLGGFVSGNRGAGSRSAGNLFLCRRPSASFWKCASGRQRRRLRGARCISVPREGEAKEKFLETRDSSGKGRRRRNYIYARSRSRY